MPDDVSPDPDRDTLWRITMEVVGDPAREPALTEQVYRCVAGLARMARDGVTLDSLLADAPHLLVMEASGAFTPDEQRVLPVAGAPAWCEDQLWVHDDLPSGRSRCSGARGRGRATPARQPPSTSRTVSRAPQWSPVPASSAASPTMVRARGLPDHSQVSFRPSMGVVSR
jgi:hypothetical protein